MKPRPDRVALDAFQALVEEHIEGRISRPLGEPHVNVLKLNLALYALAKS